MENLAGAAVDILIERNGNLAAKVGKLENILKRIVAAHHCSSVDWEAMREAEAHLAPRQTSTTGGKMTWTI